MTPIQQATAYQHLTLEREGPIAVVTLNRPQRRNALSIELMQELIGCLDEVGRRSAISAP